MKTNAELNAFCKNCKNPRPKKNTHYCSKKCQMDATMISRTCEQCNKDFTTKRYFLKYAKMIFCSQKCSQVSKRKKSGQFLDCIRYAISVQGDYCATDGSNRKLHREIWKKYNGDIPDGYVIHHKNHNKAYNDISNLQLMEWGEHTRYHNKHRHSVKFLKSKGVSVG